VSCIHCPHCIARGAFGLIDPKDPALTTNQPPAKKSRCYDCQIKKRRDTTKFVYRINVQGKAARVRVCIMNCPKAKETR
jgi:hypothetical protein